MFKGELTVLHAVPGRVRLRMPRMRGDPEFAKGLVHRLVEIEGIYEARANATTGTVLILFHYDGTEAGTLQLLYGLAGVAEEFLPDVDLESVDLSEAAAMLTQANADPPAGTEIEKTGDRSVPANQAAFWPLSLSVPTARMLIPLGLMTYGLSRLVLEAPFRHPPWWTLLWYSYGTFRVLRR